MDSTDAKLNGCVTAITILALLLALVFILLLVVYIQNKRSVGLTGPVGPVGPQGATGPVGPAGPAAAVQDTGSDVAIRLAHYSTAERTRVLDSMVGIANALEGKKVDVYTFNQFARNGVEYTNGPNELLFGNQKLTLSQAPFISADDAFYLEGSSVYAGSYYIAISGHTDAIMLNKYMGQKDKHTLYWWTDSKYIKHRTTSNCILKDVGDTRSKGKLILMPFVFDDKYALIVNYTQAGLNDPIQSFIGAMNYVKKFIADNNVEYYVIAGDSKLFSSSWSNVGSRVFGTDIYMSPIADTGFYTLNRNSVCQTPDFMFISKSFAPHGVRFDLVEPMFATSTQHYALIAEILNRPVDSNRPTGEPMYKTIYNNSIKWRTSREPHMLIEKGSTEYLSDDDLKFIGRYETDDKVATFKHLSEVLSERSEQKPS